MKVIRYGETIDMTHEELRKEFGDYGLSFIRELRDGSSVYSIDDPNKYIEHRVDKSKKFFQFFYTDRPDGALLFKKPIATGYFLIDEGLDWGIY